MNVPGLALGRPRRSWFEFGRGQIDALVLAIDCKGTGALRSLDGLIQVQFAVLEIGYREGTVAATGK